MTCQQSLTSETLQSEQFPHFHAILFKYLIKKSQENKANIYIYIYAFSPFLERGCKMFYIQIKPQYIVQSVFFIYVEYNIGLSNSVCRDKAIFIKYQSIKNG